LSNGSSIDTPESRMPQNKAFGSLGVEPLSRSD
jgi:hypothetical protein